MSELRVLTASESRLRWDPVLRTSRPSRNRTASSTVATSRRRRGFTNPKVEPAAHWSWSRVRFDTLPTTGFGAGNQREEEANVGVQERKIELVANHLVE